jgi:hypothetical protein
MADPYDQFMAGVPDVRSGGDRSVFSNSPVGSRARYNLSTNRMAATGAILEARDRMEEYRASQRARIQAPRAIAAMSQLDPVNDPDYDKKVADIFAQNRDALTDRAVQNFLGVQGGIFDRSSRERDYERELARSRAEMEGERQYRIQQARRGEKKETRERLRERAEALPPDSRRTAEDGVAFGFTPEESLDRAEAEEVKNARLNALIEAGFPEEDIFGRYEKGKLVKRGILNELGDIDPRAEARLVGMAKRAEAAKKSVETHKIGGSEYTVADLARFYGQGDEFEEDPVTDYVNANPLLKEKVLALMASQQGGAAAPAVNAAPTGDSSAREAPKNIPSKVDGLLKRGEALAK